MFGDCLCDVLCMLASMGISFLSLLNKPQMPPQRANPNPNNNNITPEMQQMMTAQTQLMQMMTTFIQNQNNNNNNNPNNNNNNNNPNNNNNNPPGFDLLTRFLRLRPAKFSGTTDPMVANDWLRSVNKDLVTIGCTDAEKVRFAAHLLEGPPATWWDNFQITTPIEEVTWAIFEDGFRTAHISSGMMSLKKKEFHNLKQRHRSVAEYIEEFNNLARYAPDEVDTDAKRKEKFLEGLNDELNLQLVVAYVPTYQSLCDEDTILENKMNQVESRKRKHSSDKHISGSSYKRLFKKNNEDSEPHQYHHNNNGSDNHGNDTDNGDDLGQNQHDTFRKKDISQLQCYNYKELGHYASDCPEKKKKKDARKDNGNDSNVTQKGHMNHIDMDGTLKR